MKRNINILLGLTLVGLGIVYLLQNLGFLQSINYLWPILFAIGGGAFLAFYISNRAHWWPLIPGFALLGLAAASVSNLIFARFELMLSRPFFLGMLALGFWAVYLLHRQNWWAIIPGGVLLTLAVVAGLNTRLGVLDSSPALFIGLALTFTAVFLATRQGWALFPAAGLLVFGLFIMIGLQRFINYLWPVALIIIGTFLILRVLRPAR